MQRKLTITIDERVYESLQSVVGRRHISRFTENLVRPHVLESDLKAEYAGMARDEQREAEVLEWASPVTGDSVSATW